MAEGFPEIKKKNPKQKSLPWEKVSPHVKHDKQRKIQTSFTLVKFQNIKDQGGGGWNPSTRKKKKADYLKTRKKNLTSATLETRRK